MTRRVMLIIVAGLLAGVGSGWWDSVEAACSDTVEVTPTAQPSELVSTYADAHQSYAALYPALKPTFHGLA